VAKVDPYFKQLLGEEANVDPAYKENLENLGSEITDPVEIFSKGVTSGAYNLAANLEYFKGIGNSMLGDQKALAENIAEAEYLETQGAIEMQGIEQFDEFLENPTFGGFIGQVASATGQFAPSAIASIGAAISGAGAGVAVAGLTGVTRGLVSNVAKKEVRRVYAKKMKGHALRPEEEDLLNGAYAAHKQMRLGSAAKIGAVTGAVAQEYPQGAGISFGTYADQDMIDPVSAFRASAIGVPFAAIGVGAEALVFKGLTGILKDKAKGPVHKRILGAIGQGAGRTGVVEGVTEGLQEELNIQQRFGIDEQYQQAQANLDRAQALFSGFFGGVGIGAAGGTIAGGLSAVTGNNIVNNARQAVKQGYESEQYNDLLKERYGRAAEPEAWLKGQLESMLDPTNNKDSVFVSPDSLEALGRVVNANPRLRQQLQQIPQHSAAESGPGSAGVLFSLNQNKVDNFKQVTDDNLYDTDALDNVLVDILGYEHGRLPDADRVVEVKDANGNVVWYQSTNEQQENLVKNKARTLFPGTEPITVDLDDHLARRNQDFKARGSGEFEQFDDDGELVEQEDTVESEQEALAAFQFETPGVSEERGIRSANQNARLTAQGIQKGEGWSRGASRDVQLQTDAKALFPAFPQYADRMNSELDRGLYSDALLRAYVKFSENNPNNIYIIQAIDPDAEIERYEIKRLNTTDGQVDIGIGIPTAVSEAIKTEKDRIFNGSRPTGWKIKPPGVNPQSKKPYKMVPVYMPTLTVLGRRINNRLGEGTQGATNLQSAQEGFNTMYAELLEQGYELEFTGQEEVGRNVTTASQFENDPQVTSTTQGLDTSNAIVFRSGARDFSYRQLQQGRAGVTPFRGNEESDIRNLKEQIISTGLIEESYVENINSIEGLERVVEEEVNPNLPANQKLLTPTRREAGEFFEQEEGDFAEATPEQERTAEYKAATFYELGSPERKTESPKSVEVFPSLARRIGDNQFIGRITNLAKKNFKLQKRIRMFPSDVNFDEVLPLTKSTIPNLNFIKAQQNILNNSSDRARFISFGNENIILVKISKNPGTAEQGLAMIGIAHEFGHAVFQQELDNSLGTPMGNRLYQAFTIDRKKEGAPELYQEGNEHAFEEWYSDKVAAYLFGELRKQKTKAKNGVESYFKRIAARIREAFAVVKQEVFGRFQQNADFNDYIQNVVKSYKDGVKDPVRSPASYEQKRYARAMIEEAVPNTLKSAANRSLLQSLKRTATELLNDPTSAPRVLKKIFYPADNFLRSLGKDKGIGKKLADIFYTPSQSKGATGLLTANIVLANAEVNKLSAILELDDVAQITPEAEAILLEVEDNTKSNEELSDKARQVREWLSDFYDRQDLGKIFNNKKIPNYFPRLVALYEISEKAELQDKLSDLLLKNNEGLTEKSAREVVEALIADPETALLEGNETDGEGRFNLGLAKARAELFKNIPTKEMRDAGLLEAPAIAVRKYLANSIKRSEFNKRGGAKAVADLISQLPENEQGHATDAIDAIMGRVNPNMGGTFRFINSWGLVANITTLLAFAVFASLPDFAGPVLRSKEFNGFSNFGKELANYFSDREEAARFAKDIGVVSTDAINTMYINAGELDFMSGSIKLPGGKEVTPKQVAEGFFRYTGLEWYTRFTRIFAAGMGRRFLLEHQKRADEGDVRSQRYLKELNVTPEQIKAWNDSQNVEAHPEVKLALARFVDESIVRPNAAERPVWASDPRLALVWQLKSFFYAYGKNIVGGFLRESSSRVKEGAGLNSAALPLLLAASTLLPLSMLGLDLRERFKVGLAWVLPGVSPDDKNYRKSQDMEWDKYSFEILDRSGVFGPFALAMPLFMESKRFGDPFWVGPLGPSVEKGYDLLTGDLDFKDITPIYNQI
tara:strand:+ start:4490 stop:10117 length:5628 start_codon:yes stop_codon:yes gene_type:complete